MFIPTWVLWVLFYVTAFSLSYWVGGRAGSYDFVTPLISLGISLLAVVFGIGYALAKWLG
jgi:hypothetical protein